MPKYVTHFKVEGLLGFPIDMLRYDSCYPRTQQDVSEVHASLDPTERRCRREDLPCTTCGRVLSEHQAGDGECIQYVAGKEKPFRVELTKIDSDKRMAMNIADARWASFGWRVIDRYTHKV